MDETPDATPDNGNIALTYHESPPETCRKNDVIETSLDLDTIDATRSPILATVPTL